MSAADEHRHLRVLIANEQPERLALLAGQIAGLGYDVVAQEVDVRGTGEAVVRQAPDVAIVVLGDDSRHALELIGRIAGEASCPVIALLATTDGDYVREAARRGVYAAMVDATAEELESSIDISLQRFAELRALRAAFARRATIEQAKGILMVRHTVDADRAFGLLREHSQHSGQKVVDLAQAIVDSHQLLLPG